MFAGAASRGLRYKKRTITPVVSNKNKSKSRENLATQKTRQNSSSHCPLLEPSRRGSLVNLLPLPLQMFTSPKDGCNTCLMSSPSPTITKALLGQAVSRSEHGSSTLNLTERRYSGGSDSHPLAIRKRSGSYPTIKFTLSNAWHLKPAHVRALKVTWGRLCDTPRLNCRGIFGIMERVFEKFEIKEKTLKDVFYRSAFMDSMADCQEHRRLSLGLRRPRSHSQVTAASNTTTAPPTSIATLRDHIHFFVSLVSQVISSLERAPHEIFEHVDKIGCFHAHLKRYGFRAAMWDRLGVCLIDGLVVQDCVRGYPEACRAWTVMVAALIDRLRSAPTHITTLNNRLEAFREASRSQQPSSCTAQRRPSSPIPSRSRASFNLASLTLGSDDDADDEWCGDEDLAHLRHRQQCGQRSHSHVPLLRRDNDIGGGGRRASFHPTTPTEKTAKNAFLLPTGLRSDYLATQRKSIV